MLKHARSIFFATLLFSSASYSQSMDLLMKMSYPTENSTVKENKINMEMPKQKEPTLEEHLMQQTRNFGISVPREVRWLVSIYGDVIRNYADIKEWNKNYASYTFIRTRSVNGKLYVSKVIDWKDLGKYNVNVDIEVKMY